MLIGVPPPDVTETGTGANSIIEGQSTEQSDLIGVSTQGQSTEQSDLIGVPTQGEELKTTTDIKIDGSSTVQSEPPVVTNDKTVSNLGGAQPKTTDSPKVVDKPGSRGAFKSQLHGLRRGRPKDRAYKCKVCDKSKRSMEDLNAHHRKHHDPQKCGVCGKVFELVSTRTHHMYSHYERKHQCDKCSFHCFFKSELEAHKFRHRERPTFKCMYPKCGRWFKRKGELSLHVEVHNST